jgi:hypothetical protein
MLSPDTGRGECTMHPMPQALSNFRRTSDRKACVWLPDSGAAPASVIRG